MGPTGIYARERSVESVAVLVSAWRGPLGNIALASSVGSNVEQYSCRARSMNANAILTFLYVKIGLLHEFRTELSQKSTIRSSVPE